MSHSKAGFQEVRSNTNRSAAHGWTCVYEKKDRGGGLVHGRKRSHTESNTVAMVSGSQIPAVSFPAASGASVASEARNSLSESPIISSANSGERTINTRNEALGWYLAHHDEEKAQDGKEFSVQEVRIDMP